MAVAVAVASAHYAFQQSGGAGPRRRQFDTRECLVSWRGWIKLAVGSAWCCGDVTGCSDATCYGDVMGSGDVMHCGYVIGWLAAMF